MTLRLLNNQEATLTAQVRQQIVRKYLQNGWELRSHVVLPQERGILGGLLYWQKVRGIS